MGGGGGCVVGADVLCGCVPVDGRVDVCDYKTNLICIACAQQIHFQLKH